MIKHISGKKRTKRGNFYNTRPTKVANGYSKVLADSHKKYMKDDEKEKIVLALAVRGTTDKLTRYCMYIKHTTKSHPMDPEYTKSVVVLSDFGKGKLRRLRASVQQKRSSIMPPKQKSERISQTCIDCQVVIRMSEAACIDLRQQKQAIVEALSKGLLPDDVHGIVHLLDHIQDNLVKKGYFPEDVVFPQTQEESNG